MARVRWIGPEPVTVPELGDRYVEPDEIVEVPDERYWGYACQSANWEEVEPPVDFVAPGSEPEQAVDQTPPDAPATGPEPVVPAPKKTAARPQKVEG